MKTQEALTRFLLKCEERGLATETRRKYHSYLRHFAEEYPNLPTDKELINLYLRKRKETPAHRGEHFKMLQAFYAYLELYEEIKSPDLFRRQVGRPRKVKLVTNPATEQLGQTIILPDGKISYGGVPLRIELHIYLHRRRS